jgi:hypothetical protein
MALTVVPFFAPSPLIQLYGKVAHFGAGYGTLTSPSLSLCLSADKALFLSYRFASMENVSDQLVYGLIELAGRFS